MAMTIYADPMRMPFVDVRTGKLTREAFLYLLGVRQEVPAAWSEGDAILAAQFFAKPAPVALIPQDDAAPILATQIFGP
jgi:hypothetical protein